MAEWGRHENIRLGQMHETLINITSNLSCKDPMIPKCVYPDPVI